MICSGGYPDCNPQMSAWMDDDMLGFAAGYQRPSTPQKVWHRSESGKYIKH